jgi:predicted DNA-binding transcriptional regulator AlpA
MLLDRQVQLRLPMGSNKPKRTDSAPASTTADSQNGRPGIDQLLSTRDVMRITGKHRCTVYRWIRAGTFPPKRAGGGRGWLRSDVERWLANGA